MSLSSPCINICVMDAGLCIGCGRTLDEIARWGGLSEMQRRAIMQALPARLDAHEKAQKKAQADRNKEAAERNL